MAVLGSVLCSMCGLFDGPINFVDHVLLVIIASDRIVHLALALFPAILGVMKEMQCILL